MAEQDTPPIATAATGSDTGTVPVTDRRPVPQGLLPRRFQTWLLAGLAFGILVIIMLAGEPRPPAPSTQTPQNQAAPSADRLRDYQDRLRAMETRASVEEAATEPVPEPAGYREPASPPPEDPLVAEQKRRDYESLFASNVVLSRRPEGQRPDVGRVGTGERPSATAAQAEPSLDAVADAVLRANARAGGALSQAAPPEPLPRTSEPAAATPARGRADERLTPDHTAPIEAAGPHRLLEGTVIDAVLTNRLDGGSAGPVNCLVTNPVFSHSGQSIVIPAGARVLGETRAVQSLGETRLAVAFHRLVMPDGRTYRLDRFLGMNQIGDAGLRDQVNHHYLSTFGAAAAVGLITGFAQWLGTAGYNSGSGDRTVVIGSGAADATAQASLQVMSRFLNRLPTVTIREGHRVKVYLTSDLELPAYPGSAATSRR
jgi:type IV secretion system protein VirB10